MVWGTSFFFLIACIYLGTGRRWCFYGPKVPLLRAESDGLLRIFSGRRKYQQRPPLISVAGVEIISSVRCVPFLCI